MERIAVVDVQSLHNAFHVSCCTLLGNTTSVFIQKNDTKVISELLANMFVLVHELNVECKKWLKSANINFVDLNIYNCPSLDVLHKKQLCHYTCPYHKGNKHCSMCNVQALYFWLKHDSTVMRFVSIVIKKFITSETKTQNILNMFEWCYMPAEFLLLCASSDIPRLWNILPDHLKTDERFKGMEYCTMHNNTGTQWDGPFRMKKQCFQCMNEEGNE